MTYEIVKTLGVQNTGKTKREAFLVKTTATICRKRATFELYEVDHLIVEALRTVDDGVVYEETHVVASDEHGTAHDSVLYLATRALTVEEAMFSIGHVLAPEVEYEAPAEPVEEPWAGTEFTPGHPMQIIKTEPVDERMIDTYDDDALRDAFAEDESESEDDTNGN